MPPSFRRQVACYLNSLLHHREKLEKIFYHFSVFQLGMKHRDEIENTLFQVFSCTSLCLCGELFGPYVKQPKQTK